jgi:hypothetical protein
MVTKHFEDEIRYLAIHGEHYAFHAPERPLFPAEMREAVASLAKVAGDLKRGVIDKPSIASLCDELDGTVGGWVAQARHAYLGCERKAAGGLAQFCADLAGLAALLNKNRIIEGEAIERVKKIDAFARHLKRGDGVEQFAAASREFSWLRDALLEGLESIKPLLSDEAVSIPAIARELAKVGEAAERAQGALASESERFEEKLGKARSDLLGAKERLELIKHQIFASESLARP